MSVDACAALVEQGDPDRFAATMAAPVALRGRLWPLYAFNLELAKAAWASAEPMIAEMRLQWWRDGLAEAAAGARVRDHDVMGPLALVVRDHDLPVALLGGMIEARRWDLGREGFGDAAGLLAHLDATAGSLMVLASRVLGAGEKSEPVVRRFAFGVGLANWLLAVPVLVARGRQPLPDPSEAGIAALAGQGLAALAEARGRRGVVPRQAAPALLAGWQAGGLLAQVVAEPGRVLAGTVGQSEFVRRGGLAWRGMTGRW